MHCKVLVVINLAYYMVSFVRWQDSAWIGCPSHLALSGLPAEAFSFYHVINS